ncbi:glycosyltransferase family 25 protein [Fulvimarina sp. MAC3]|uniref:glycosyltransferase family 25 protein n=1 Tax=Fulvimarina sp. MAC3 TaxID=3148887 RepID=UPI0031FC7FAE
MIAAHYINLERAKERRLFMERQGTRLGMKLQRFAALCGRDVADNRFSRLSTLWERPLSRVEIALLLSHASLWDKSVEIQAPLAIFEDDAVLSPRLPAFLDRDLPDYDLINLEYYGRRKFFRRYASIGEFSDIARDKAGSAAYVVSPTGAQKLLTALDRFAAPSDAFLFRSGRLEIAQVEPALAVQADVLERMGVDPGIRTTRQIHQPRAQPRMRRKNWVYGWRRTVTQLQLIPLHLGRGTFYELRKPRIDLAEFVSDHSSS